MQKTKFTSHKQYLYCLLFSRNVKMNMRTTVYYILLVLSLKRNNSQTFKCSSSNKLFLQCICYWYNLFLDECFLFCDNWKTLFSVKVYRYFDGFSNRHVARFFERGPYFPLSPQYSSSIMLIPKFKNLLSSFYFINFLN